MMKLTMYSLVKIWLISILLLAGRANSIAQAPNSFSYQAVIRGSSNALVKDQAVGVRLSILQTTSTGTAVYVETHTPTTNANGLISLVVGGGTPTTGTFATIDWTAGPYFIKTETDPAGGTSYSIEGTSQLLSVPFALQATKANSADRAETADYATTAGSATTAETATNAGHATNADLATLATNVTNVPFNAYQVYVKAGATDGTGTQAKPFATILEGYNAVSATGTVHILAGTYNVSTALTVSKNDITFKGYSGTNIVMTAAESLFTITGAGVTVDGLNITSDAIYTQNFIRPQAANCTIINNRIYGPQQSGSTTGWTTNRALEVSGGATNLTIRNNIMYSLRQAAYLNSGATGHIVNNTNYASRGFVVAGAIFTFSGNSWGLPANEDSDIAILDVTAAGITAYSDKARLQNINNSAVVDDQRP